MHIGRRDKHGRTGGTYIFPDNSTETRNPHDPRPTDFIHKQTFPGEHGLADALTLQLFGYALRGGHEGIFAYVPLLAACETNGSDISQERGREEELAGTGVGGCCNLAASDQFLNGEFDSAFKGYGWGHGDHDTWTLPVSFSSLV